MTDGPFGNRIKETSTTEGTGSFELDGAVTGFQTFVVGLGNETGDTTGPWTKVRYWIVDTITGDWERGFGTITDASPDTLARSVEESTNSNNLVDFSEGTKIVFCQGFATDFTNIQFVRLAVNTNISVSAGATLELTDFTVTHGKSALYSSGVVTAPFSGLLEMGFHYMTAEGTTEGGPSPQYKLNDTAALDYTDSSGTNPVRESVQETMVEVITVSKDDEIKPCATNTETDAANSILGDANLDESFVWFKFTKGDFS